MAAPPSADGVPSLSTPSRAALKIALPNAAGSKRPDVRTSDTLLAVLLLLLMLLLLLPVFGTESEFEDPKPDSGSVGDEFVSRVEDGSRL